MEEYDNLKLENQLCFPLYACAKAIVNKYKPFLEELDLTYTQYITMMVLWDKKEINVKELGNILSLDSGTLTPVLKKLENKKYVQRKRSKKDERILMITITDAGIKLKEKVKEIPSKISKCINLDKREAINLYELLYKVLNSFSYNE